MDFEYLVFGAGAMGLSLAFELSQFSHSVGVIHPPDQQVFGTAAGGRRPASWAAAGILPPASREAAHDAYHQLVALGGEMHACWASELRELAGIDVRYVRSGGLHVARSNGESASLAAAMDQWRSDGVEAVELSPPQLSELEPALSGCANTMLRCCLLPAEAQVHPPSFLEALKRACTTRGVQFIADREAVELNLELQDGLLRAVHVGKQRYEADKFMVATGAWSREVLVKLGFRPELIPVRGQIVLFQGAHVGLQRIVNEGPNYLVPRLDGHILAGSTVEEVGFDQTTTADGMRELSDFAQGLIPALSAKHVERSWAGLRPKSGDGFPYVGRLPSCGNVFLTTGHYRSGILLAPATARVLVQLARGVPTDVDLRPFRIDRE